MIDAGDNPFLAYDMPKRVAPDRRRLSRSEIRALEDLDVEPVSDLQRDRDAFVLAFYGGGIRFGDVCSLTPDMVTGGRLRYRMMKTDTFVSIPLPEPAEEIVRFWPEKHEDPPFLFPYLDQGDDSDPVRLRKRIAVWNQMANRSLKTLARRAKINSPDQVTFHVARHSFADFARRSSGDLYAVSEALGHSNLNVTERYLSSFDQDAVDTLADDMWSNE